MEHSLTTKRHPADDTLELFALGRLDAPTLEQVEEHLFVCDRCQATVTEADEFGSAIRAALAEAHSAQPAAPWWRMRWRTVAPMAAMAVAAMLLVSVSLQPPADLTPTPIILRAQRGGPADVAVHAPSGAPLELRIQSSYLTPGPDSRLSIVDETGHRAWSGSFDGEVAYLRSGLSKGTYWVRLYDGRNQLQQEYGLKLD
jgi:hypothetical protein